LRQALALGGRTLLALTCHGCGKLLPGNRFARHRRNRRDPIAYVDRRCTNCKWGVKVNGGRNAL